MKVVTLESNIVLNRWSALADWNFSQLTIRYSIQNILNNVIIINVTTVVCMKTNQKLNYKNQQTY